MRYQQGIKDGARKSIHRIVMEKSVGRTLGRLEYVHHINGNKLDNRIQNLKIVSPEQHAVEHGQLKYPKVKTCVICGDPFEPHPTKRKRKQTCSRPCQFALISRRRRARDSDRPMPQAQKG